VSAPAAAPRTMPPRSPRRSGSRAGRRHLPDLSPDFPQVIPEFSQDFGRVSRTFFPHGERRRTAGHQSEQGSQDTERARRHALDAPSLRGALRLRRYVRPPSIRGDRGAPLVRAERAVLLAQGAAGLRRRDPRCLQARVAPGSRRPSSAACAAEARSAAASALGVYHPRCGWCTQPPVHVHPERERRVMSRLLSLQPRWPSHDHAGRSRRKRRQR
jgi:hypothetical protein